MVYDIRGNKIQMNDPDMGVWQYEYNALGQLTKQTDAKSQVVTMQYDELGRMVNRDELEGQTSWQYDATSNGVGKITSIQAPLGYRKQYSYDNFGRAKQTTTYADNQTFNVTNQYDSNSRINKQILPKNFIVENVYNNQGYLSAVRSPKGQITDYDWDHLADLLEASLVSVEQALEKANYYEQKVAQYKNHAQLYLWLADVLKEKGRVFNDISRYSSGLNDVAEQLTEDANSLIVMANKLQQEAKMYKEIAEAFFIAMNRFIYLSTMDVPADKQRSYIATDEQKNNWSIGYYSSSGQVGASHSNGYASCKDKNWCDILVRVSKSIGDMFIRIAQQKVQQAQELLQQAHHKQMWAEIYLDAALINSTDISLYTEKAEKYIQKAEQASEKAVFWRNIAENAVKNDNKDHYQAMLADSDNVYFWRAKSRDAANRLTGNIFGNGLSTEKSYNKASGHLLTIKSGFSYNNSIRDLTYQYDKMDNVISRQNHINGLQEQFNYDNLDRLTSAYTIGDIGGVNVNSQQDFYYDINGNILYKSDVGRYDYPLNTTSSSFASDDQQHAPVHSPTTISQQLANNYNSTNFNYDANGNMTRNDDKQIAWTSFNKPKTFSKDSFRTEFVYAPDRSRYLKVQTGSGIHKRTNYVGKVYEQITDASSTQHRYFIYADNQLITIHTKIEEPLSCKCLVDTDNNPIDNNQQPDKTRYLHRDNLGSIDTITDGKGNIVERMSYDAFGKRRTANWRSGNDIIAPALTNRGFTGHEHIDEMGLIHMNGRVYDPNIGRFLSADPHIQAPYNTQSYNRYSYVLNNPLKYTDPSGYNWFDNIWKSIKKTVKKYARVIVAAVASYYTFGLASTWIAGSGVLSGIVGGAASGFVGGGIVTGSLKGAINGAITGGIMGGIAGNYGKTWNANRVGANAVGGGIASEVTGGRFKDGFKMAGLTSAMRYVYNGVTGTDSTWRKGEGLASKYGNYIDKLGVPKGVNVIGNNKKLSGNFGQDFWKQGGAVSNALNKIYGANSTAYFHDTLLFNIPKNIFTNYTTIPLSLMVNYGSLLDHNGLSTQLVVHKGSVR